MKRKQNLLLSLKKLLYLVKQEVKRERDENDRISKLIFASLVQVNINSLEGIIKDDTKMSLEDEDKLIIYIEDLLDYKLPTDRM